MIKSLSIGVAPKALAGVFLLTLAQNRSRGKELVDEFHAGYLFWGG